jgi:hypothetical protein
MKHPYRIFISVRRLGKTFINTTAMGHCMQALHCTTHCIQPCICCKHYNPPRTLCADGGLTANRTTTDGRRCIFPLSYGGRMAFDCIYLAGKLSCPTQVIA